MRWSEANDTGRRCDVALGYHQPSYSRSEGGSSSCDDGEGWILGANDVDGWGFWDGADGVWFYHITQWHTIQTLGTVYFWSFPFNIFRPQLTEVTEEESKTADKDGGLLYK